MREILIWIEISERRIIRNDCFMTHILQNCKCTKIQCSIYFITFLCFINFQSTFSFRNFAGSLKLHALYSFYSSWRPLIYVWYHTSSAYNALFITPYFLKISTYRYSQCMYMFLSHVLANYTSRIYRIFPAAKSRWTFWSF